MLSQQRGPETQDCTELRKRTVTRPARAPSSGFYPKHLGIAGGAARRRSSHEFEGNSKYFSRSGGILSDLGETWEIPGPAPSQPLQAVMMSTDRTFHIYDWRQVKQRLPQ